MAAAQEVSTAMLSGAEEDEALHLIAQRSRQVADACASALVLPGWEGQWVLEIADGEGSEVLVGSVMPPEGRAVSVVRSGQGLRVAELSTEPSMLIPALRAYGPALYAPLVAGDERVGVLMLLRHVGEKEFTDADLTTAQTFAGQAALALQLADGRRRSEEAELLQERARISRDLHDLVVQELFAMGMRLGRLREGAEPQVQGHIDSSLESLDRVVRQIRSTIRALRDTDDATGLADRLHGEANRAHISLGFHPQLQLHPVIGLDELVPADVADDVVAVVREGLSNAARHARAASVVVDVEADDRWIVIEVADDGVGLPPDSDRRSGLDNLLERARRHGGDCAANPNASGGATLRWRACLHG
jgi:signal transduction histidine kinase